MSHDLCSDLACRWHFISVSAQLHSPAVGAQYQGISSSSQGCPFSQRMKARNDSQKPVPARAKWADDGLCSPDGVPSALDYFVHFESMDIDLLSPLAQPAGHSLCSGEFCEEGYKRVTDAAGAAGTLFRPSLAASFQEGQPIDGVADEVQAGAAAQSMLCSHW